MATLSLRSNRFEPTPNPVPPDPNRVAVIYGIRACNNTPLRTEPRPRVFARAVKSPQQIAQKLLFSYLTSEERESWRKKRQILIPSQIRPAFTYQITPSLVYLLNEKGERIESYCLVPKEPVPAPDVVLSKYILLKGNEQKFLSIANTQILRHADPRTALQARRENIDVGTIDHRALEDAVVRLVEASAILDGIASDEAGLVVRDLVPDDFNTNNNPNNRRRRD
jgi:hypothetical protein